MEQRVVIIGAGHAGTSVAETLRNRVWSGEILMLSDEKLKPYNRPPLSKAILSNGKSHDDILLNPPDWFEKNKIDFQSGCSVGAIDLKAKTVQSTSGQSYRYDYLVIATGSGAMIPKIEGISLEGVVTLRNIEQALDLRQRLKTTNKMVIIGGGLIGMEVASATGSLGIDTTVVECASSLLSRVLPKKVASKILTLHQKNGTKVRLNARVASIVGTHTVKGVQLDTGEVIEADTVLLAAGAFPETALAEQAGLNVEQGIVVNQNLQTSAPYIYAAGDVAKFPTTDGVERLENWRSALDQGQIVAENIMGEQSTYASVPWMWSDQFEKIVLIAGKPDPTHLEVIRNLKADGVITFHLSKDGILRGATAFGDMSQVSKSIRITTIMIEKKLSPDIELLASETADLRKMLKRLVSEQNLMK